MDEENQGFAIPARRPMFGEGDVDIGARPLPESDLFMAFENDAGDKAVILTSVETVGDEVLERHGRTELEQYAQSVLNTGDDPMELQVGNIFEGETALADAEAEAFRLDEEFNPGEGAPDEELAMAVDAAKGNAGVQEEETFPEDMEAGEGVGGEELGLGDEAVEEPELPVEEGAEQMLEQFGQPVKKKRPGA
jgi:hypothetical protein